jgi:hypothetical protein
MNNNCLHPCLPKRIGRSIRFPKWSLTGAKADIGTLTHFVQHAWRDFDLSCLLNMAIPTAGDCTFVSILTTPIRGNYESLFTYKGKSTSGTLFSVYLGTRDTDLYMTYNCDPLQSVTEVKRFTPRPVIVQGHPVLGGGRQLAFPLPAARAYPLAPAALAPAAALTPAAALMPAVPGEIIPVLGFNGFTDDEDDDSFDTPAAAAKAESAREAAAREAAATAVTAVCAQPPAAAPVDDDVCVFAKRSLDAIFDGINKRYKMEHEQREKARDIELQEEKKRYMAVVTLHCARLAEACIEAFNTGGQAEVKIMAAAFRDRLMLDMNGTARAE